MGLFDFMKKNTANDDVVVIDANTITTLVGKDTTVKGSLETSASVRIDGNVFADIKCGGVVVITNSASVEGTVMAESIIIAGEVKGDIYIKDKVNIEASGKVTGDIYTSRFTIDENAVFDGKCNMNKDEKLDFSDFEKMIEENKKAEENSKESAGSTKSGNSSNRNKNKSRNTRNRKKIDNKEPADENKDSEIELADIKDIEIADIEDIEITDNEIKENK